MQDSQDKGKVELVGRKKAGWLKIVVVAAIAAGALYGYKVYIGAKAQAPAQTQAAEQLVSVKPVVKTDASHKPSEYVGRVEAIQSVLVTPQISGEVARVCFKEGSMVKAGQLLFQIDPLSFQAAVEQRRAELERAKATLDAAEKYFARVQNAEERAVSAAERDNAESAALAGRAAVAQAKAALRLAEINLGYTRVTAPITGKIGAANFTKGNYVTPASGPLATIVQMDPIRVSYTMPDKDYLDQLASFKKNGTVYKTKLILSNGAEFNAQGERDFEGNEVDTSTGTIMMNLRYANGDGTLIPGSMVRVRTKPLKSDVVTAIPQTAVMADQQGDYVYVIGSDDTASAVRVTLGRDLGELREVTQGLAEGQKVATAGLQNLRDGMKVKTADRAYDAQAASGDAEETK